MAKSKKKVNPDKIRAKPSREAKKNPFEVKVNKQKHQVINRKAKCERGLPGVARDRAISKRKSTLLSEYVQRNKDNTLLDRRIGEGDATLDPEERIAMRLAKESNRKLSRKKNIFNLNDDEVLTHLGQSIEDMDPSKDDPRSDDEDIFDKLDAAFVKDAHFGGFMTKAKGSEDTRKRTIDDLIAESKRAKYERQLEVDENVKITEELDSKWKDLHSIVHSGKRKTTSDDKPDDFDVLIGELQYAPRAGVAMDRTKTKEEIEQQELRRLEELEAERRARARGEASEEKKVKFKHVSADDLDDGFAVEDEGENAAEAENGDSGAEEGDDEDQEEEDQGDGEEEDEDDGEDSAASASEAEDSEADEDSDDSYDDLKLESDSDEPKADIVEKPPKKSKGILKRKLASEPITADIPYLITVPDSADAYENLIKDRSTKDELTIVERIIKGNAPSLHEQNKRKLEGFLQVLIDRIYSVLGEPAVKPSDLQLVDGLVPFIHQLVGLSPMGAGRSFMEVVKNIYQEDRVSGPKKDSDFPGYEKLVMFKLISICFSVSDYQHAVATPALICMAHMLTHCKVTDGRNMARGLFLAQLMIEYVAFDHKYCPEVIAFIVKLLSEFRRLTHIGTGRELRLSISDLYAAHEVQKIDLSKLLYATLNLVDSAATAFADAPSFTEIFAPIYQKLKQQETGRILPDPLKDKLYSVLAKIQEPKVRRPLCRERKRPQMIKLYEPLVEDRVDLLRKIHRSAHNTKSETRKLQAKYRKELKGAMREVRRDNQFMAQHKLKEQIRKDSERKMKVKRLFGELANQQGELNAMQKANDKEKKKMKKKK